MGKAAGHEVDRLEDLEGADLLDDEPAPELTARFLLVGAQAPDEVRLGVHQRPVKREKIKKH